MNKIKIKKAAVYDRWLFTLGGGEQVAFAYAECLRDLGYETSLITHQKIDTEKAQKKMGVNLKDISIVYLPMMSSEKLTEYTEGYDVFINTSYLDYFPNRSKVGLLSIFFPGQIFLSPYEYLKRAIVLPSFSNFFIYPSLFEGFKYDQYKERKIYKWMSKESSIIFNKNVGKVTILLFMQKMGVSLIDGIIFSLDKQRIYPCDRRIQQNNVISFTFDLTNSENKRFTMTLPDGDLSQNVALIRLTILDIRYVLYNIFKRYFPKWEMRLHGGPGVTKLSDLTSYTKIITISDFCKYWIKKYWGMESLVLYPPVSTDHFLVAEQKKNWILHVGRFFVTGHNKKQLELVKVFQKLVDEKGLKNWELHFVGSVHDGEKHKQYFEQVKYYAKGYPVFFHMDASFSELRTILSQSKIYWHATGLDEDEKKNPIVFEHFGITTVEAMASGCVPVVIHAGGQKEIVTPESGYTWSNRNELIEKTFSLTQNEDSLKRLSQGAIKRSEFFDRTHFKERFEHILNQKDNTPE